VLQDVIEDPFKWGEVIDALKEFSFIRTSVRDTKFSIHRLLQAVIQDGLESATRSEIETVLLHIGLINFPKVYDDRKGIDACRQFRAQVVACLEHTKNRELRPCWTELAERVALFAFFEGMYVEASHWWGVALAFRQRSVGEEHVDTLYCKSELGKSLDGQGRSQDALTWHKDTLAIQKRVLGPEHPDTLCSMDNLAVSYDNLGQFKGAADLKAQILNLRKRDMGPEHPDTLRTMNNLAVSYTNLGQFKEAADLYAITLNLRRRVLEPEHPETLRSMHNLAISYDNLGQFKEAADLKAQTLNLMKRNLGPEHPDTLRTMNNLAVADHAQFGNFI
jgi:tetratricopeptide (TPR) repeat protein